MKNAVLSSMLIVTALLAVAGCQDANPPHAYRPPSPPPAATAHAGSWTKQDKIDAVQKSAMSPREKQDMIAKLNAEP